MTALDSPLARLLRAYLHEDYDLRYDGVQAALRAYSREVSPEERRRALAEIATLLAAYSSDEALYGELRKRGFIFYPPRDGETTRAWLMRAFETLDVKDAEEDCDG